MVGAPVPGSALVVLKASPDDSRIDDLYFGDEPWAVEIEEEFKSRSWEEQRDFFLFCVGDTAVAGVRMGFWNLDHPHRGSGERAKYFVVRSVGVNVEFQGKPDTGGTGQTFASTILTFAEQTARDKAGCVGMSLFVREANTHARGWYERHGFAYEPGSFLHGELPTLEMRKIFEPDAATD